MAGLSVSVGTGQAAVVQPAVTVIQPQVVMQPAMAAEVPAANTIWPPVLTTEIGQTVCNYVSWCRQYHGLAFLMFALAMVAVIVLVWLGRNGTLSLFNMAVGVTIAVGLCILFMFLYWYFAVRGIIPECSAPAFSASAAVTATTVAARPVVVAQPVAVERTVQQVPIVRKVKRVRMVPQEEEVDVEDVETVVTTKTLRPAVVPMTQQVAVVPVATVASVQPAVVTPGAGISIGTGGITASA